jgi:hypothetical protein
MLVLCYYLDGLSGNLSTLVYMIACTGLSSQLAASLAGSNRMLNRQQENIEWNPKPEQEFQPPDQPSPEPKKLKHFFGPATFYCVETISCPCGVVEAWAKFARAESESNILAFMKKVYPTKESCPDYICIEKACKLLKHMAAQGHWDEWSETT